MADGVHDMWLWVLDEPNRKRIKGPPYEVEEGLYPYWQPEALEDGYYVGPDGNSVTAADYFKDWTDKQELMESLGG